MHSRFSPLMVMLSLFSSSCAHAPAKPEEVAPGSTWKLLPPSTLGADRQVNQRLRAAYGERDMSLDCVVTVNPERLTVIGLVPGGPRMFTIDYDGREVNAQRGAGVPEGLEPELLLNDLQLTLWPLPALQQALEHSNWAVSEPDPRTRRLKRDGKLVAEVHYATSDPWSGRAWLVNFQRGYSITIDSQSLK